MSKPKHVAVIMDGNRRWAKDNGLKIEEGYKQGFKTLKSIALTAKEEGVEYVTIYAFSVENWQRDKQEVSWLMNFLDYVVKQELDELSENNIRIKVIGKREGLPSKTLKNIEKAETTTKDNKFILAVCFNYGGRQEITDAVKRIVEEGIKSEEIDEEVVESHLYTAGLPEPDLLIRTSGEIRLSNFLLWQLAYSEFVFVDKNWPEFTADDFKAAISEYEKRKRRYGK